MLGSIPARCVGVFLLTIASTGWAHGADLTNDECQQVAERIEALFPAGDIAGLRQIVDWDALLERAWQGLQITAADKATYRQGWGGGALYEKPLCDAVAAGASYHFLRTKTDAGKKRILFRMTLSGKGTNYHELLLERNAKGEPRVVDIYVYLTGETMSETLRWVLLQAVASSNRGLLAKLTGQETAFIKSAPILKKAREALAAEQFQTAMDLYRQLPEEMQHSSAGMVLRTQAAAELGEAECTAAFQDFRKYQPNNSAVDLLALDYYFLRKEYPEARRAISRLYKRLGGDPYLFVLVCNSYLEEGNLDQAAKAAQRAITGEPTLADGYWARITVGVQQKDFAMVKSTFEQLEANTPTRLVPENLRSADFYADFVKSDEFKQWAAEHKPDSAAEEPDSDEAADPAK